MLVILNEVKNLYCGNTFRYDAILHFVQNDRGGRGRMTDTRFVIARPQYMESNKRKMTSQENITLPTTPAHHPCPSKGGELGGTLFVIAIVQGYQ